MSTDPVPCSSVIDGASVLAAPALLLVRLCSGPATRRFTRRGILGRLDGLAVASGRAVRPDATCLEDHAAICGRNVAAASV
jgi:hypothetical protein